MTKYEFNITLTDGSCKTTTLEQFDNAKLSDIDGYIIKVGYFNFLNTLAQKINVSTSKINYVSIVNSKNKNVKFSIVNNNKYLKSIFNDLSTKEVQKYMKSYRSLETVISKNNDNFREMYIYLINQLRNNFDKFLINIYTYKNSFANLLHQYGMSYKNNSNTEEAQRNIEYLERQIADELSIYKNYRGLCIARSKSEKNFYTLSRTNSVNQVKSIKPVSNNEITIEEMKMTQDDANIINQFVNDIGEEKEEFLEPEEMDYDNYKKYR